MRKILPLVAIMLMVVVSFAQQPQRTQLQKRCGISEAEHFSPKTTANENRATGDVLWSEDFSGGALPAGWTVVDNNGLDYVWYWSDDPRPGITGTYSINNDTFFATTADNGYIMISGDIYNMGASTFMDMNSYFMTAPINCDTVTSAMLVFQQYFRNCCSSSSLVMQASISTDMVNWVDFDVSNDVPINSWSPNPDQVAINITPLVAGQSTVYIKVYKAGNSHYFWAIDDMALVEAPKNELEITNTYTSAYVNYYTGYYSKIPLSQIMPMTLAAEFHNNGDYAQHDCNVNAIVLDESGTEIYNDFADTLNMTLLYDSTGFLEMPTTFDATTTGTYQVTYEVIQSEADEDTTNNFSDPTYFDVTHNKIFARDYYRNTTTTVDFYVDGGDGDYIGNDYYVTNIDTAISMSVYIDYRTTPGTVIIGQLYRYDTDPVFVIGSEEYTITEADLGTWITLNFIAINPGDNILAANTLYNTGIEFYYEGIGDIRIGADDLGPHMFHLETNVRIGTSWGWIPEVPLMRLNLNGAVLPPVFTSNPVIEQPLNVPYSYTASTTDPQSLAVSLDGSSFPEGLVTITDNGDGTATVTGDSPENMGLAVDDRFRIRINADNGTSKNEQYFYVTITDPVSVPETQLENVSVYPNPANNVLFVENASNANIRIVNLLGEVVLSTMNSDHMSKLDISGLASGTYIVRVQNNEGIYTQKINIVR